MDNEEILDSVFFTKKKSLFVSVKWWEKKRWVYNVILVGVEIIMMLIYWESTKWFGIGESIIWSFAFTLVANIFFSIGWGIDILVKYYFKKDIFSEKTRFIFFVLGLLFSIFLTINMYYSALSPFYNLVLPF